MLHTLKSPNRGFQGFEFKRGLNIILSERSGADDAGIPSSQKSRNGSGKSSLIDIIHFLLGGKAEGALQSEALKDYAFDLVVDVGDNLYDVHRAISDAKVVELFEIHNGYPDQISNTKWCDLLGYEWFNLTSDRLPGSASYRQLISYFARRRRDGGYDVPIRTFRAQSNAVCETNLALLFGLDAEVVRRFYQAKAELKQNEAAQKALAAVDKSSPLGKRRIDLESELSAQIAASALARDNLKERISSFNVLPAFRELENELASINQHAIELSDHDVLDQEVIDNCEKALHSEFAADTPQLNKLFEEAKIIFPEIVDQRYGEVARFHAKLVENRQSHLHAEIKAAHQRIDDRQSRRERLESRRLQIASSLRSSGPADELLRLRDELAEKEGTVRALEARLAEARQLEARGEEIQRQLEDHTRALRQDRRERAGIVDHASRTFSEISERLYETPGQLAISATEAGLQFVPRTPGHRSAGVTSMDIFCFDLTISALCISRGIGPGFLIHDSHLFEPVDGRQFAKALRIGADFARDHGVQYIVTLNSDELSRAEIEGGESFSEFLIKPILSDTPNGGLFGFRFD